MRHFRGGLKKSNLRTYANLMTTMMLGSLWHGASWTFVAWGALHGGFLAAERWLAKHFGGGTFWKRWGPRFVLALITCFLVNIIWVFFRAGFRRRLGSGVVAHYHLTGAKQYLHLLPVLICPVQRQIRFLNVPSRFWAAAPCWPSW